MNTLQIALAIGVTLSLIFSEIFGVSPSGMVVPGYLALLYDQPIFLIATIAIAILTYFIVTQGLSRIMILYGRRKFVAMMLVAMILNMVFNILFPYLPIDGLQIRGIGAIVPGLIANTSHKQGWVYTIASTTVITMITILLTIVVGLV